MMPVTSAGVVHALSTEWLAATQVPQSSWFLGLINNSPTPSLSPADTLVTHAGWVEIVPGTGYTGNRMLWDSGTPANVSISTLTLSNTVTVNFAILATATVYGALLCTAASGTSGVLSATAPFAGSPQAVNSGDTLQVTFSIVGSGT